MSSDQEAGPVVPDEDELLHQGPSGSWSAWRERWTGFRGWPLVVVVLAAVAGSLIAYAGVRDRPGIGPDGSAYVAAASNLHQGRGLSLPFSSTVDEMAPEVAASFGDEVPLLRWPPGFPLAIAAVMRVTGAEPLTSAGILLVVLGGLNLGLVAFLAIRFGGSVLAGVLAALLVGTQEQWRILHSVVSSEPLLIAVLLLATLAMLAWLEKQRRMGLLLLAGVCGMVAPLVRYAGVAVPLTVGLTLLVWGEARPARRVRGAAVLVAAGLLPVGIWFLTRSSVAGQESHKTFRAPPANQLQGVADTATSWFAPLGAPALFRWTVFVVVAASLGLVVFQLVTRRWSVFPFGPVLLVIGVYTVVLLVSASYFGEISLGGRLLAPVQPLVVVLVAMALAALVAEYSPVVPAVRWMVVAPVSLVVLIGWFAPPVTLTIPVDLSTTPVSIAEAVERVPEGTAIYTTDPELVWSLTGRTSYALPSRLNQESSTPNEQFGTWVGQVAGQVAEGRAAVLYLDGAALLAPNLSNLPELNRASPRPLTTDALPGGVNLLRRA